MRILTLPLNDLSKYGVDPATRKWFEVRVKQNASPKLYDRGLESMTVEFSRRQEHPGGRDVDQRISS